MTGNVRPETMERITTKALADAFIEEQIKEIRAQVGVKNGKRYEGWTAIIRAVNTTDAMTATIAKNPYPLLHAICDRITHEVEGINRVFMDITPKPIGTIEFE